MPTTGQSSLVAVLDGELPEIPEGELWDNYEGSDTKDQAPDEGEDLWKPTSNVKTCKHLQTSTRKALAMHFDSGDGATWLQQFPGNEELMMGHLASYGTSRLAWIPGINSDEILEIDNALQQLGYILTP